MDIVNNEHEQKQQTKVLQKTDQMQIDAKNQNTPNDNQDHHDTTTQPPPPIAKTTTTKTKHNTTPPKEGLIPRSAWQPAELALPVGWTITRHRRGTQGSITSSSAPPPSPSSSSSSRAGTGNQSKDFYKHYHNPEGKKFRSFKQCVEFLGLPPSAGLQPAAKKVSAKKASAKKAKTQPFSADDERSLASAGSGLPPNSNPSAKRQRSKKHPARPPPSSYLPKTLLPLPISGTMCLDRPLRPATPSARSPV